MSTNEYVIQCWNCLGEFDALTTVWCGDSSTQPTKICPFCLKCFCIASPAYIQTFWDKAPPEILADKARLGRAQGPLGERLIKARVLTTDQLLQALRTQEETGGKLGEILVQMGFLTAEALEPFLAQQQNFSRIDLKKKLLDGKLIERIGVEECQSRKIVPVELNKVGEREVLTLAMVRPSDGAAIDFVQSKTGCQIIPAVCSEEDMTAALAPFIKTETEVAEVPGEIRNFLSKLLSKAVKMSASDVHIEPHEHEIQIHLRIDGVLYRLKSVEKSMQTELVTGVKQFLKLSTAQSGVAQDGRVIIRQGGVRYEIIANILPTLHGENVSLKLINKDAFVRNIDEIGMKPDELGKLHTTLNASKGLLVCASPLFSGSSSTFYAVLARLGGLGNRRVISIESPLITTIPGVQQSEVNAEDSAEVLQHLRSAVNAHPQALFLSQLFSDEIAVQMTRTAASTLVGTTLEGVRAAEAIRTLLDHSISPSALASQLNLVVCQRLLRRLCPDCKTPASPSASSLSMFGLTPQDLGGAKVYHPGTCEQCGGIGYRGRVAIFEALKVTPAVRALIEKMAPAAEIEAQAVTEGMTPLRKHAVDLVAAGETSLDEFQKGNFTP
jgi:type IV pilus assembly protein PilB